MQTPNDDFEVVKTEGKMTDEELKSVKQMVKYWESGKVALAILLTLGMLATGGKDLLNLFMSWVQK